MIFSAPVGATEVQHQTCMGSMHLQLSKEMLRAVPRQSVITLMFNDTHHVFEFSKHEQEVGRVHSLR